MRIITLSILMILACAVSGVLVNRTVSGSAGSKNSGTGATSHPPVVAVTNLASLHGSNISTIAFAHLSVNSLADPGDGACDVAECTLREAINAANANAGPDVIDFSVTGTINLTGALPAITDDLTITGPGAPQLTVQRDSGGDYRVFTVILNTPRVVTISGLTMSNGLASGDFPDNIGGGIANLGSGQINILNCVLSANAASGGGAIANAPADFNPAALVYIQNTVVSGNTALEGGGIWNQGTLVADSSMISSNPASGGCGGGIASTLTPGTAVTITNSTISNNSSSSRGGGICASFSTLTITGSTISGNFADSSSGGGISTEAGDVTISNSTLSGNATQVLGGAISNFGPNPVTISNSTISGNNAALGGGGIYSAGDPAPLYIGSTILALNTQGMTPSDVQGVITSQGYNVIGNNNGTTITPTTGDQIGVSAAQLDLGPLQDNGGPTQTIALGCGSVAIDKGINNNSLSTDQRGLSFARTFDNPAINNAADGTDVGAFELLSNTLYRDADGDGYGDPAIPAPGCSAPAGYVANNTDCDDTNPAIHPGAPEICDGLDNNCNGQIDEGFPDTDGDGRADCVAPALQFSTSAIDFGSVPIGSTSAPHSVTLSNPGSLPLLISGVSTEGGEFNATSACGAMVPASGTCVVDVRFAPPNNSPQTGALRVDDNAPGAPHRLTLTGRGRGVPSVSVSPLTLTFANQLLGTTSLPQTVTLTNTGNDDLLIASIAVVGTDFQAIPSCTSPLAPASSCTITVVSAPTTAAGYHQARLQVADNAPGSPHAVTLIGYGDVRALTVAPSLVNFSARPVNTTSTPQHVTVTNSGTLPVALGAITIQGSSTAGYISTFAGGAAMPSGADGVPATAVNLLFPTSVALDPAGNLFFVESGSNGAVRRVDAATRIITTVWTQGSTVNVEDGIPTRAAARIALDRNGNLFVGEARDFSSNAVRIRRLDAVTGTISTIAGNGVGGLSSGDGGPATAASLNFNDMAIDAFGNVFISDFGSNTIRRVDAVTGLITRFAGNGAIGTFGTGDGGPATAAGFQNLLGIALDPAGNLLIRDTRDLLPGLFPFNVIRRVDTTSGIITTIATLLPRGQGLALDASGNAYVAGDSSLLGIFRIDAATGALTLVSGGNQFSVRGDGGPATQARLLNPNSVVVDQGGNLYIADRFDARIRRVDGATADASAIFTASNTCNSGLDVAASCDIAVSFTPMFAGVTVADLLLNDDASDAPQRVRLAGLGTHPVPYLWPSSVDFGTVAVGATSLPQVVVVANGGNAPLGIVGMQLTGANPSDFVLSGSTCGSVIDPGLNCRVQIRFAPTASGPRAAALTVSDSSGGSRGVPLGGSGQALSVSVTPGSLQFADQVVGTTSTSQSITITNTSAGDVTFGATTVTGANAADFHPTTTCGSLLSSGAMCTIDVSFAPAGTGTRLATLLIADNAAGSPQTIGLGGNGTANAILSISPSAVDFGFVPVGGTPAHRVVTLTNTGTAPIAITGVQNQGTTTTAGRIHTIAGGGPAGHDVEGDSATNTDLGDMFDVAADSAGNLYLADSTHHRIRRVDSITGRITTVAGNGSPGYIGDGGPATSARLNGPAAVAVDRNGTLYVSDTANHVIRRVDTAGTITTIAGSGSAGYAGDGGPAINALLDAPIGIAIDPAGNLLFADSQNHAIRRIDTSGMISTVAGTGFPGSGRGSSASDPLSLNGPQDIAVDLAGNLYIADTGNKRVARIDPFGVVTWLINNLNGSAPPVIDEPAGLAIDALGRLFVAETLRHRILVIDQNVLFPSPTKVAGSDLGLSGFVDNVAATACALSFPRGLAVDTAGNLYVADQGNHRIRRVDGSTTDTSTEFRAANGCGPNLGANQSCDIDVSLAPASADRRLARLSISDSAAGSPHFVDLIGFGTQPITYITAADAASVSRVGFLDPQWRVPIGSTDMKGLTLFNTGNGPLHLNGVTVVDTSGLNPSPFSVPLNDCPATVLSGERCLIQVGFTPPGIFSTYNATLRILHDGLPNPHALPLSALGEPARTQITLTPSPPGHSVFGEPFSLAITVSSAYAVPTGTVSLREIPPTGPPQIQPLDSSGHATFSLPGLLSATHRFQVTYDGDSFHSFSFATLTQIVDRQATTTTLSTSAATAIYGKPVTVTAVVTPLSNGQLSGAVVFKEGASTLDTVNVVNGMAAITRSDLAAGTHDLTATYTNDPNSLDSVSFAIPVVVSKATTTTTVVPSTPAYVNQDVTLTATVAPQFGGVPTGTVTFRTLSNTLLAQPVTLAGGQAVLKLRFTSSTSLNFRATYNPDSTSSFTASTSPSVALQVIRAPTTVTIMSSPPSSSFVGQSVTFTISVSSPAGPPSGSVTVGGLTPMPLTLTLTNGTASYSTSTLTAGLHNVLVAYAGDSSFTPAFKSASHNVNRYPTTLTVASDVNPSTFGQRVNFRATITSPGGVPSDSPPQMITFYGVGPAAMTAPLVGGVAQVSTTTPLQSGNHSITASYAGDGKFLPRTSTAYVQTVNRASTTVALTSSQNPTSRNVNVTFTATVASGAGVPGGQVLLKINGNVVRTQTLSSGKAQFSYSFPLRGQFTVTATYNMTANFATATSAPINEVVN